MGNQNRPRQPPTPAGSTPEVPLQIPGTKANQPSPPYKPPFVVNTPPIGVSAQVAAANTPPPAVTGPQQTHPLAFQEPQPGPSPAQPLLPAPVPSIAAPVPQPQAQPQPVAAPPSFQVPHDQPVVQDLMQQLINSQRQPGQNFYLVVVPDAATPCTEEFSTIGALLDRMITLLGTECALFPFLGHKLSITKGPTRFLRTPFGGMLPLFRIPAADEVEVEETGWVGRETQELVIPQHESEMAAANAVDDAADAAAAAQPQPVMPAAEDDTPAA